MMPFVAIVLMSIPLQAPPGLEPLGANHPGLVTDLGVGLWAWPLPMDWDGDGDLDLLVNSVNVISCGTPGPGRA